MLINSILCNSEVLYGLNNTHIETLESVDRYLWRNVFGAMISTPIESYYIETNTIPIRHIIMGRRLMYYWTILKKDETEVVKKVLKCQTLLPSKNDWILQLQNDLEECGIELSEENIKNMKKEKFKNLVLKKIKTLAKEYLLTLRGKHSKSKNLMHRDSLKDYLKTENVSVSEKKLLFALKTRQINVKTNFRTMFSNLQCRLCKEVGTEESEIHIMKCEKILSDKNLKRLLESISYADIFGTLDQQVKAVKVWKQVVRVWNLKLEAEKLSPSGHQVHQLPATSTCIIYDFG